MPYWYDLDKSEMPSSVHALVTALRDKYIAPLAQRWDKAAEFYAQAKLQDHGTHAVPENASTTYNVVRIATDTVLSRMLVDKPAPKVVTTGASEKQQQRAKKLEKLILGVLQTAEYDEVSARVREDGVLLGTGWLKVFCDDEDILLQRVDPRNVLLDPQHLDHRGMPYSLFQVARMQPEEVEAIFGVKVAATGSHENTPYADVYEAWRRPTNDDMGVHVICTADMLLVEPEDYEWEGFPLIPYRPESPIAGFWPSGLGPRLEASQTALDFTDDVIRGGLERWNTPILILPPQADSQQQQDAANPYPFQVMSEEPKFLVPPMVSQDLLQQRERIKREALESVGVGPYQATGVKPAGLESGVAIQWHYDIESQQLTKYLTANERLCVATSRAVLREAQDLAEDVEGWSARYQGSTLATISWKEADMDADQYAVSVHAASALPNTLAGRVQTVTDLANSGALRDPRLTRQLLRMPDLDGWQDLEDAPRDAIQTLLDDIISNGADHMPEQWLDLELAMSLGVQYWAKAKVEGRRIEIITKLADWCQGVVDLMNPGGGPGPAPSPEVLPEGPEGLQALPPPGMQGPPPEMPLMDAMPPEAMPPMPPQ